MNREPFDSEFLADHYSSPVHLERAGEQGVSYLAARREVAARPANSLADKL